MKLNAFMDKKAQLRPTTIRGFIGTIGSGKSFKCDKLKKEGFIQIDFADCLREMCWKIIDWSPKNSQEYDDFKKGLISIPGFGKLNGRKMLQELGNSMRNVDEDFWVKKWKQTVDLAIAKGYDKICVSDCRYENEARAIWNFGMGTDSKIEFCDYHSDRYNATDTHKSEEFAQRLIKMGKKDGDIL